MVFGTIGTQYDYDFTADKFQIAFAFLDRNDLDRLPEGWINLDGGVRASVQHYTTMDAKTLSFETHERYFDIQYLVEGKEKIGVCTRNGLAVKVPYEGANDITFYEEPPLSGEVLLRARDFVILGPEDAHKPRCIADTPTAVIKIVVKVPVQTKRLLGNMSGHN